MNDTHVIRRLRRAAAVAAALLVPAALAVGDRVLGARTSFGSVAVLLVAVTARFGDRRTALATATSAAVGFGWPGSGTLAGGTLLAVALTAAIAMLMSHRWAAARPAPTDPLTGALDRRAFLAAAESVRRRAERVGEPVSVAYLDVDGFKAVNDRYGHQAGDRILAGLGSRVATSIRATDVFGRVGGDEFVLVLPGTGAAAAAGVLRRARTTVAGPGRVTVSVGIATFLIVPTTVEAMIDAADRLMYRAKREGPNRIVGAVVAGPWLRWDPSVNRGDPSIDVAEVAVEILPARAADRRRPTERVQRAPYTPGAAYREPQ